MKSYLMLQNVWFTAFTVSELLRENQQGGVKITPTQIRVNWFRKFAPHISNILSMNNEVFNAKFI